MVTVTVKLSEMLANKLATVVERRGISKSGAIREALERYLDNESGADSGSFAALGRDLIIDDSAAPSDLATNPEHLEGFGE